MNGGEKTRYLSNLYMLLFRDGQIDSQEERLVDSISKEIRASHDDRHRARNLFKEEGLQTDVSARWSDRIRNLEDLIFAAYLDGTVEPSEKRIVVDYAKHLGIDQRQLNQIKLETRRRAEARQQIEEASRRQLEEAEIPYPIADRPMPIGEDLDDLMPPQVGPFLREPVREPADVSHVYVSYKSDHGGIFCELGVCEDSKEARQGVETARSETIANSECVIQVWVVTPDLAFMKSTHPKGGVLVAWSRGNYYFSAHAKNNKSAMDEFMNAFPY